MSGANDYENSLTTDEAGVLIAKRLPFGIYRIQIQQPGFAEVSQSVEIRSAIPVQYSIRLALASVTTSVDVQGIDTLIDPYRAGSSNEIGSDTIDTPSTSRPGRSLQDLSELRTRLALRRECRSAPTRLGIPDAIRDGWHSTD